MGKLLQGLRYLARLCTHRRETSFLLFCLSVNLGVSAKKKRIREQARRLLRLGLIDPVWYRARYGTLAGAFLSPAVHYLKAGYKTGCLPNPLFDSRWYLRKYKRRLPSGANPLLHYLEHGAREGLNPHLFFDTQAYQEAHPELEETGGNPLVHYLAHHRRKEIFALAACNDREEFPPAGPLDPPRVAFISHDENDVGHIYRVERYAQALAGRGYSVREMDILDIKRHLGFLRRSAVIVLWRTPWNEEVKTVVDIARQSGAKLVFDIDDLLIDPEMAHSNVIDWLRSNQSDRKKAFRAFSNLRRTAQAASFCSAPTRPLAAALEKLGKPCFILPNGFDQQTVLRTRQAVERRRSEPADGLIRIGYAGGTATHQKDFGRAANAVALILRKYPQTRLVLFRKPETTIRAKCLDPSEYPEFADLASQLEWWPLRPLRELPDALARFDINLAPLENGNPYCEAKSELKYFEAALAEVPTVASPTVPFAEAIRHGETGFLASGAEEWFGCLERLVTNPEERTRVGRAAYDAVYERYGPERRGRLIEETVKQMLAGEAVVPV